MTKVVGAKAILYHGNSIVCMLRDEDPVISFPGYWDLPGGGLEGGETAPEALVREIEEELGLRWRSESFVWDRIYERDDGRASHFFAAPITSEQIAAIRFGSEGQCWRMMDQGEFIRRADAVPHFRTRVADFFQTMG